MALACRQVFFNTRLGALARPEMLERGDGLVRTYNHCFASTIDEWNQLEPLIYEVWSAPLSRHLAIAQPEVVSTRRMLKLAVVYGGMLSVSTHTNTPLHLLIIYITLRYIATQTSAPHKRRASAKTAVTDHFGDEDVLAGFALIEHDVSGCDPYVVSFFLTS